MNDDSVEVWARYQDKLPELTTFSICTWIKFTYERIYNQLWSYCNNVQSKEDINLVCSSLSKYVLLKVPGLGSDQRPKKNHMQSFNFLA